jgi:hypothetical protein
MRNLKFTAVVLCSLFLGSLLLTATGAQKSGSNFVIDPSKPYAYLEFDHVGKRQPLSRHEPDRGLWIRLVNNCRLPITVGTFDSEASAPGIAPYDEIIRVELHSLPAPSVSSESENPPSNGQTNEQIPEGYPSGEIINTTTVQPGTSLLLSLPANHVGSLWHLQIRFYLKTPHHDYYGDGPYSVVSFGISDVPKQFRNAVGP